MRCVVNLHNGITGVINERQFSLRGLLKPGITDKTFSISHAYLAHEGSLQCITVSQVVSYELTNKHNDATGGGAETHARAS